MKWTKGTGASAAYFIVSDCMGWQVAKSGEPPIYTLIRLVPKSEIVLTGSLAECKEKAANDRIPPQA